MSAECFVGLQMIRNRNNRSIFINQEFYINRIIERFRLQDAKGISTPADSNLKLSKVGTDDGEDHETVQVPYREAIGSLMYAMIGSRPDIAYIVSFLSQFLEAPKASHWNAVKRIFRYLKTTSKHGLSFSHNCDYPSEVICYVDSDFAGDVDSRKSTAGYLFIYNGAPISWRSQRQSTVALSTTEAEFVAASLAARETLWIRQLLSGLGRQVNEPTKLFIDNQSAIKLIRNPQIHARTKHIDVRYKFIREKQSNGDIDAIFIGTDEQLADILAKALAKDRFINLIESIGLNMEV